MKKKIVSVIVAIISVACFIGCSRSADKEEVDIESIRASTGRAWRGK